MISYIKHFFLSKHDNLLKSKRASKADNDDDYDESQRKNNNLCLNIPHHGSLPIHMYIRNNQSKIVLNACTKAKAKANIFLFYVSIYLFSFHCNIVLTIRQRNVALEMLMFMYHVVYQLRWTTNVSILCETQTNKI